MPRTLPRSKAQIHAHRHGRWAEKLALAYFLLTGWRPVSRGTRSWVQTDLLFTKGRTVILVEVKFRRSALAASFALGPAQAQRLRQEALRVAKRHPAKTIRVDAFWLVPQWPFFRHIPNAVPPR